MEIERSVAASQKKKHSREMQEARESLHESKQSQKVSISDIFIHLFQVKGGSCLGFDFERKKEEKKQQQNTARLEAQNLLWTKSNFILPKATQDFAQKVSISDFGVHLFQLKDGFLVLGLNLSRKNDKTAWFVDLNLYCKKRFYSLKADQDFTVQHKPFLFEPELRLRLSYLSMGELTSILKVNFVT